ncbi:Yip1 domain protein [Halalkalicoccus paucihalophilus]|uniref:Yip1 domain protein n=1 Tax=Halalkalicoccus paucihalophilus TaxID=1008153 RepID=A0A151AGG5_9EURY|nr:YIP1 family protein [Halalkalicoccus paucihalophilus]KYH26674.1 Yip1 domain protein [Halalkalicoccus paucihalophilus]
MTQWVENPTGGRERGPRGIARAWVEVLLRPRRFYRVGIAPGDQAPGLVFAVCVVTAASLLRLALAGETVVGSPYPTLGNQRLLSVALVFSVIAALVAPLVLHLTAALQTFLLLPFAPDRAGVSETVQVIGYATAPCVLVGVPIPAVQALATGYGAVLFVIGIHEIHSVSLPWATALCALPAAAVFGVGFGGFEAIEALLSTVR